MTDPTVTDLFLAWRQAKAALFYERGMVGLIDLAEFEQSLPDRLPALAKKLAGGRWFDDLDLGDVWVVPKRVHRHPGEDGVTRIEAQTSPPDEVEVQTRLSPSPEFAIAEVLYLWAFGPMLDRLLPPESVGYRLKVLDGAIDRLKHDLYLPWPTQYQKFCNAPILRATQYLTPASHFGSKPPEVTLVSADVASFFPSISPGFLVQKDLLARLRANGMTKEEERAYTHATRSLLRAIGRFQHQSGALVGSSDTLGLPIGALTSKLIANLALLPLDEHIKRVRGILCYRRYVDDLFIAVTGVSKESKTETLSAVLPLRGSVRSGDWWIDVKRLGRASCRFKLQSSKVRVHHLTGKAGRGYLMGIKREMDRLVSRHDDFVHLPTLHKKGLLPLTRGASNKDDAPRPADPQRLTRLELGLSLSTMEKLRALLPQDAHRLIVSGNLDEVEGLLIHSGDWSERLDLLIRLLRITSAVGDARWMAQLTRSLTRPVQGHIRKDGAVSTVSYLRRSLTPEAAQVAWRRMGEYLRRRQLEAVASAVPLTGAASTVEAYLEQDEIGAWMQTDARGLVARARALAEADLRVWDREDDGVDADQHDADTPWLEPILPDLRGRFDEIRAFQQRCTATDDSCWRRPPARVFLSVRPPSYVDVATRLLSDIETAQQAARQAVFSQLVRTVNALRGTAYRPGALPMTLGEDRDGGTVKMSWRSRRRWTNRWTGIPERRPTDARPRLILVNLSLTRYYPYMTLGLPLPQGVSAAEAGASVPEQAPLDPRERLVALATALRRAMETAEVEGAGDAPARPTLLVFPELAIPRTWCRKLVTYLGTAGVGAVLGVDYRQDLTDRTVANEAWGVFPGPIRSAVVLPWVKRRPADEEGRSLHERRMHFKPIGADPPRIVVETDWGRFSTLICSELIETRRVADLFGRVDLVLCPAWNPDTASFDHLVQSAGFQLHAIVAIANNGYYSDCRAWAPYTERWRRDLCRLIERGVNSVVHVDLPLPELIAFRDQATSGPTEPAPGATPSPDPDAWKPLPPGWPPRGG